MKAVLVVEDAALAGLVDRLTRMALWLEAQTRGQGYWYTLRDTPGWEEGAADMLEWISERSLPHAPHVRWEKLIPDKEVPKINVSGFGRSGAPPSPAALLWRRRFFEAMKRGAAAMVLGLDTDQKSRMVGLEEARELTPTFGVALAAPHPEAEAWYLLGLQGRLQAHEAAHHSALCRELRFDPCETPHQLSSTSSQSPRDAKRALRHILEGSNASSSVGAEEVAGLLDRCFNSPACVERHAERGVACGLNAFVEEVRTRLWR